MAFNDCPKKDLTESPVNFEVEEETSNSSEEEMNEDYQQKYIHQVKMIYIMMIKMFFITFDIIKIRIWFVTLKDVFEKNVFHYNT